MPRSLLISVRFYEGQYHGQEDRFDGSFGWPPSPGRLFQALVAGSACGANLQADDVCALKWLEDLAPPRIAAPAARRGRAVKFYVPNNDLDSAGGDPDRASKTRVDKCWRPCYFDPDEPVLYVWEFESGLTAAARIWRHRDGAVSTRTRHRHGVGERPSTGPARSGCASCFSPGPLASAGSLR